jgi:hypothetical protein
MGASLEITLPFCPSPRDFKCFFTCRVGYQMHASMSESSDTSPRYMVQILICMMVNGYQQHWVFVRHHHIQAFHQHSLLLSDHSQYLALFSLFLARNDSYLRREAIHPRHGYQLSIFGLLSHTLQLRHARHVRICCGGTCSEFLAVYLVSAHYFPYTEGIWVLASHFGAFPHSVYAMQ